MPLPPGTGITEGRVVLEGSDVIVGTGRAVIVAAGGETCLGAIRTAPALDEARGTQPFRTILLASLVVPPVRNFLGLTMLPPLD